MLGSPGYLSKGGARLATEPVQDLVRIILENQGYYVRTNARFSVVSSTKTGKTSAYSDVDILAAKFDTTTGYVTHRIWAEVKAHLTLRLRRSYLKDFASDYAVFLDLEEAHVPDEMLPKLRAKKERAHEFVRQRLGEPFEKRLYFAGPRPTSAQEEEVRALLPDVGVYYVQDLLAEHMDNLQHQEGNEPVVRVITLLRSLGFLKH